MISRYISTALCAAASVPFRSGGVAASLQGEGLGERIGMEWVLDKSVIDFSFFGKSVLDISLFNCVGFSVVGLAVVGKSNDGLADVNCTQDYGQQEKWRPRLVDRLKSKDVP